MHLKQLLLALCTAQAAVSLKQEPLQDAGAQKPKRVAIIGAGAAGASAAYHLHKYAALARTPVEITIFEREAHVGGRSTTVQPFNDSSLRPVELGASIFVEVNHILQDAVREFNLTAEEPYTTVHRILEEGMETSKEKLPFMGIWDGKGFVVRMDDTSWWSSAKMLWRYGLAPYYAEKLTQKTVDKFLAIYNSPFFPFASLTKRVYDLGLRDVVNTTAEEYLADNGVGEAFVKEVIQAMTRVNYASNVGAIHGLEGIVSIAASGAVAVEGGNWRIFDGMIKASGAELRLETVVDTVERHKDGTFTLTSSSRTGLSKDEFDTVILAASYHFSGVNIEPLPHTRPEDIAYVGLHVTLFTSPHYLSSAAFGLTENEAVPRMLLTTLQSDESPGRDPFYESRVPFNSISLLGTRLNRAMGGEEYLYKIFSMKPVDDAYVANLLGVDTHRDGEVSKNDVSWIYRKLWFSYPYEIPRDTFEELRLDQNLWYTTPMESFISCMETMALMGKNVANLIVQEWVGSKNDTAIKETYEEDREQPERIQVEL